MNDQFINCPKCGEKIKISDAFTHDIEESLRKQHESEAKRLEQDFEGKLKSKEKEFEDRLAAERGQLQKSARKHAEESVALDLADLKNQLNERSSQLNAARQSELELRKREREL